MANATQEQPSVQDQYMPHDADAHEADKARREVERKKKAPLLDKCLDGDFAARAEARKTIYDWEVAATFNRRQPDARGIERMQELKFCEKIPAHTEADAWAMFCDKIGHYPSKHKANLTIKKLGKIGQEN